MKPLGTDRSANDRLTEIAELLAAGLARLRLRAANREGAPPFARSAENGSKSSPLSANRGESSLDFSQTESGHSTGFCQENGS